MVEPKIPNPKGHLVRFFREKAQYSLQELANRAGLHIKTMRRAEQDQLTEYALLCISRALGVAPVNFYDPEEITAFLAGRVEAAPRPRVHPRSDDNKDSEDILDRYSVIPKRYVDRQVEIIFKVRRPGDWTATDVNVSEALGVESGACVQNRLRVRTVKGPERWLSLYATGDLAETMLDIAPSATVRAQATTVYAFIPDEQWRQLDPVLYEEITGLMLKRLISVGNVDGRTTTSSNDC